MTDNLLIGPKPDGLLYPTPWRASNWGNLEDANGYTLYFPANGVPLKESRKLGPAIVDAVNAYYGGPGGLNYLQKALDAKDARIVNLEGRAQVAEERVKKLEQEALKVSVDWRSSRIAELERKLKRAHDTMADLGLDVGRAEAELEEIGDVLADDIRSNGFIPIRGTKTPMSEQVERRLEANRERAEKAEARVRDLEFQLEGATESLEEARSAYLQLSKERMEESVSDLVSRMAIPSHSIPVDTFTAPDGRVFRVGQRVYGVSYKAHLGKVTGWDTKSGRVYLTGWYGAARYDVLRRVWDGSEEPDVPVATVLRDAEGSFFRKTDFGFLGWQLWHKGTARWSLPLHWDDWDHSEEVRPYVEVLPGDD